MSKHQNLFRSQGSQTQFVLLLGSGPDLGVPDWVKGPPGPEEHRSSQSWLDRKPEETGTSNEIMKEPKGAEVQNSQVSPGLMRCSVIRTFWTRTNWNLDFFLQFNCRFFNMGRSPGTDYSYVSWPACSALVKAAENKHHSLSGNDEGLVKRRLWGVESWCWFRYWQ